jgi:alcohol dehydrogenase YqhD (iron-dependent ADH family)
MKAISDFNFHMYTEIVFGKGVESQVADLIKKYTGTKVMLVYGAGSIKRNGLYDRVVNALNNAGIPFVELDGVQANPRRSLVEKGLKKAKENNVDFFLGVGGGSSIDTAKAIALAVANNGDYWKFYFGTEPKKMAPVGVIHTIAAAGSETSRSSVLVDDIETGFKKGFMWNVCRPKFAVMNPELTFSLPAYQTAAGATDIFAHTYMRYFTNYACYLGDQYCEGTLRTVVKYARVAVENPNDYRARAELMLAGSFSHNDLTGIGRGMDGSGGEHGLEHQLSGYYDTAHGAGLAVIMPALLEYAVRHGSPDRVARVAQFGANVFGVESDFGNPSATATEGLSRFRAWLKSIGMPVTLNELGIPKEDLPDVIKRCVGDTGGRIDGFLTLDEKAIAEIFTSVAIK